MWIEKKILTEKYKYQIYKTYGMVYREMLLGKRFPTLFLYAELEREIEEEILKHPNITEIENFEAIMERNKLKTKFSTPLKKSFSNIVKKYYEHQKYIILCTFKFLNKH